MSMDAQGSLFGEGRMAPPTRQSTPDPEAVRGRLHRLLEVLRAAEHMPLSDRDVRMWQTVVPNMTRWLPDEDARAICAEFAAEMERLGNGGKSGDVAVPKAPGSGRTRA
ncbi:conserved hypothetical protein [uncultured Defluviicoccus sp.]|uniref:Uncharacterized protein n=1 Tax=metagenome TaxID=256318 RepID=A0A380THH1_9ZZZZ|nr:conserved hypothetical protein [uncultured Defluviicoccus sp.]